MFGGVGVGRVDGLVKPVGQHDGGLGAAQRRANALGVLGAWHAVLEVFLHLVGDFGGVGEQHGTGELIMLGLADEVGGQKAWIGGFIGDDADFGGAGDRVDAHERGDQRLGGSHKDVARTGDLVNRIAQHVAVLRFAALGSISEHGDGLSATDRIHFINTKDGAGGENGLVRQTFLIVSGWRGSNGQRFDARGLSRHGVHNDGARVNGLAARHIQADALNRNPAFGHAGAFGEVGVEVLRHLIGGHGAGAAHRFLDGGAHFGVERGQGVLDRLDRHAQVLGTHVIELLLEVAQGSGAAFFDIVQNRTHQIGGFGSTHCSTRHRGEQFGTGQVLTTQVNDSHDVLTHNAPS